MHPYTKQENDWLSRVREGAAITPSDILAIQLQARAHRARMLGDLFAKASSWSWRHLTHRRATKPAGLGTSVPSA